MERELLTGETYTGDELVELCGADVDGVRHIVPCTHISVVGKKATVIACDVGNDNYEVIVIDRWIQEAGFSKSIVSCQSCPAQNYSPD